MLDRFLTLLEEAFPEEAVLEGNQVPH